MEHLKLPEHKAQDLSHLIAVDPFGTESDVFEADIDRLLVSQKSDHDSPLIFRSYRARALLPGRTVAEQFPDIKFIEFPVIFLLLLPPVVEYLRVGTPVLFHICALLGV